MNNLDELAEDANKVKKSVQLKAKEMDHLKLEEAVNRFGSIGTKRFFSSFFQGFREQFYW